MVLLREGALPTSSPHGGQGQLLRVSCLSSFSRLEGANRSMVTMPRFRKGMPPCAACWSGQLPGSLDLLWGEWRLLR